MNAKIWNNSFFSERSDIIINFNNNKYKLNKEILLVCKTFKDMFSCYEESTKKEIDITMEEINVKGWEMMLNYIYKEYKDFYNDIYGEMYDRENIKFYSDPIKIITEDCIPLSELSIIDILFQYMNYHPIISKLFISLFLLVKIENIEIVVKFIILCTTNDNDLYFSINDLITIAKKYFYIPPNITSFSELNNILTYKTEQLADLIDNKFFFCSLSARSTLINYFVLEYFRSEER